MTTMTDEIAQLLKSLHLARITEILDEELANAEKASLSYQELLVRLLRAQWHRAQENALAWRIERAKLPEKWTLESFPFKKQPGISHKQMRGFAELDFVLNLVGVLERGIGKGAVWALRGLVRGLHARTGQRVPTRRSSRPPDPHDHGDLHPRRGRYPGGLRRRLPVPARGHESAGKRKPVATRRGSHWLRVFLVQAAWAATHAKGTFWKRTFERLRARLGPKQALIAIARKMLVALYRVLKNRTPYRELGADHVPTDQPERRAKKLVHQLKALGFDVQLAPTAVAPT
jgi:hypothetical protein